MGTNYFLPFWVCRRSKIWCPKPLAAIKVPAKPFLSLSGTLHHIPWPVEQRIKRVTTQGCFLQTTARRLSFLQLKSKAIPPLIIALT